MPAPSSARDRQTVLDAFDRVGIPITESCSVDHSDAGGSSGRGGARGGSSRGDSADRADGGEDAAAGGASGGAGGAPTATRVSRRGQALFGDENSHVGGYKLDLPTSPFLASLASRGPAVMAPAKRFLGPVAGWGGEGV